MALRNGHRAHRSDQYDCRFQPAGHYIAHWLEILKSDDQAMLTAAAKAEDAASVILKLGEVERRERDGNLPRLAEAA